MLTQIKFKRKFNFYNQVEDLCDFLILKLIELRNCVKDYQGKNVSQEMQELVKKVKEAQLLMCFGLYKIEDSEPSSNNTPTNPPNTPLHEEKS